MGLRISVLRALCCLSELEVFSPVCCKILQSIVEMFSVLNDPNRLILLKYGMQLWESRISNAKSMNSELLVLFPYLQEIMKNGLGYYPMAMDCIIDHSQAALKIIAGYVKLGGGKFFIEHASVIHMLLVVICGNLDFLLKKDRGLGKMDTRVFGFGAGFAYREEVLKGELNSGKPKNTNASMAEQEDEIGSLDEIKEEHEFSSSSESSTMRVAERVLFEDLTKLEKISIRSAGLNPAWQLVSVAAKELCETLRRDPFLETDWQETAKQEAAAGRVDPTLPLPSQPSNQVAGLFASSTQVASAVPRPSIGASAASIGSVFPMSCTPSSSAPFLAASPSSLFSSLFETPSFALDPPVLGSASLSLISPTGMPSYFGPSTGSFSAPATGGSPLFSTPFVSGGATWSGASFGDVFMYAEPKPVVTTWVGYRKEKLSSNRCHHSTASDFAVPAE